MAEWRKKRASDEVPTPIAVAVSDFCRRAKAPSSPTEIREALSLLANEDDFRVRSLTDGEPEASPLGPFAVVDILGGTPPQVAAQRQECGYYELAQQLANERETQGQSAGPTPRTVPAAVLSAEVKDRIPSAPPPAPASAKASRASKPTVQERIAPRKREVPAAVGEQVAPSGETAAPRRELPQPRGRFTRLATQKRPVEELADESSRDYLASLVDQHTHRVSLLQVLEEHYSARGGKALTFPDLEPALAKHRLLQKLERSEREVLLAGYTEHKGASGRVAWALGLSPSELEKLVQALDMTQEVTELRERFKREALAPRNLAGRLNLLGRTKYLSDLGIQKRFMESLTSDLRALLQGSLAEATDLGSLAELAGRKHGAPAELISRAMDRLGLTEEFRKRLSSEPAPYSH